MYWDAKDTIKQNVFTIDNLKREIDNHLQHIDNIKKLYD
jgi:hypothetical protein